MSFSMSVAAAGPSTCNGQAATMLADPAGGVTMGTELDDVIVGTPGADTIDGRGGSDTICGLGGADVIRGSVGDDWIDGGSGSDRIHGNQGADTLDGGPGDDQLAGGAGNDSLFGGPGEDVLRGGSNRDTLEGGARQDRLFGGGAADMLDGGDSDDHLVGGAGPDIVLGGPGADEILGRGGADVLEGGDDIDVIRAGLGIDECVGENLAGCEITAVSPGDRGRPVDYLQKRLARALLYRGPIDGAYSIDPFDKPGELTAAIYAFHKLHQDPLGDHWTGGDRVRAEWTVADWHLLESFEPEAPRPRDGEPNRLEVDARHEVMWLILDGEVAGIFHVSIGGEYVYWYHGERRIGHTPRGNFDIDRYSLGTRTAGYQYKSWYFEENYFAVHGFYKVPPYPDSHGCVRVTYNEADWLTARLRIGWPIHVWEG